MHEVRRELNDIRPAGIRGSQSRTDVREYLCGLRIEIAFADDLSLWVTRKHAGNE